MVDGVQDDMVGRLPWQRENDYVCAECGNVLATGMNPEHMASACEINAAAAVRSTSPPRCQWRWPGDGA